MWRTDFLDELGDGPPLVVRPGKRGGDRRGFLDRARERRGWIQEHLRRHGALLFRGFLRGETAELEDFSAAAGLHLMSYVRGNAARRALGRRVYTSVKAVPQVRNGLGVSIVSTSKGIMSDTRARSENVGGEVLCTVF